MPTAAEELLSILDVRPTKELLCHEQTISKNLKRLKEGMLNIGHLVDPLVVDGKTNVVLDGNHRLKVLEIIECPCSACQIVDYSSPEIKVGTWLPAIKRKPDEFLKPEGMKIEKVDAETGRKAVEATRSPFMVMSKGSEGALLLNPGNYKMREMVEEQVFILSLFDSAEITYIPDTEADAYLEKGYTVLMRRPYTKDEIVKAAKDHAPFPPKSTRHLIPGRIIRLNMKLGWLHFERSDAKKEMEEMLKRRAYNGNVRKYYEPVVVIY
jgi:hypothetical protein